MTHHAIPALQKGHGHHGQGKDKAVPRTQKGQTFGMRRWVKPESTNGVRDRNLKEQLYLGNEGTSGRIFRESLVLGIMK
jgi:hypothetical protein